MIEHDLLSILLRILVYVASIAVAGGVLFAFSFPRASMRLEMAVALSILAATAWITSTAPDA
jgi:hypothetical protein